MKKIICFLLALLMVFSSALQIFAMELSEVLEEVPENEPEFIEEEAEIDEISAYAVDPEKSLEETIREQVEAFAKSIDQKDANGAAADKLVAHGIGGRGKKLSVGKSHPLTATLINSELMKYTLTVTILNAAKAMQGLDLKELQYIDGGCGWYKSNYYQNIFSKSSMEEGIENRDWRITPKGKHTGFLNDYDSSLLWMVGHANVSASISQTKITKSEITYKISLVIGDRFDFDSGAGLISGIGALLFKEFDWESKVSFNIKVPYSCSHKSGTYHWTYDAENKILVPDDSDGLIPNAVTRHEYESGKGAYQIFNETSYYHELDETVRLYHNKPWVLEYDIKGQRYFVFSPLENYAAKSKISLLHAGNESSFFWTTEFFTISEEERKELGLPTVEQLLRSYSGIQFKNLFTYTSRKTYTFTYENKVDADGSNMVFVSVRNAETGEVILENIPMSNYYKFKEWSRETTFIDETGDFLSGKDLFINYVGNETYRLSADYFDLRVWENGKDSEQETYFTDKITKPTCEAKGYTTHTCALCGYSYKDSYTDPLGHSFGEWETVTEATAENPGEEKRSCAACDYSENRVIPAIRYSPADANLDGSVNVMDAYFARLVAAKLIEPTDKQLEYGDVDGDGKITAIDANIIRKFVVGILTELPVR